MVAVGNDQHVEAVALACRVRQVPAAVGAQLGARDRALEADLVAKAEVIDVGLEVGGDVRVVREVRARPRHREVRELHPVARRVDVQVAVGGRHSVAVAEDPVAADAVGGLEALERDPPLVQRLGRRDPGRAGADDRGSWQLVHEGGGPPKAINVTDASPYRAGGRPSGQAVWTTISADTVLSPRSLRSQTPFRCQRSWLCSARKDGSASPGSVI